MNHKGFTKFFAFALLAIICASFLFRGTNSVAYVEEQPKQTMSEEIKSDIPKEIDNILKDNVKERYPDDYTTQLYVLKKQREAYKAIQQYKKESDYDKGIYNRIESRHPNDYTTQLYLYRKQIEAKQQLAASLFLC